VGVAGLRRAPLGASVGGMVAILIIDRDAALRLAARRVLEAAGFAVTEAPALGASAPADLVIADPAAANAAALRRLHPCARLLPLADAGLRKPFTGSELLAAVRLYLARPGGQIAP